MSEKKYKKITRTNSITKLSQIVEGYTNLTKFELGIADAKVEKLASEREEICNVCPLKKGNKCNKHNFLLAVRDFEYEGQMRFKGEKYAGCGCGLQAKWRCETCNCPVGKWSN